MTTSPTAAFALLLRPLAVWLAFVLVAAAFLAGIGQPPLATLARMVEFAVGDAYSLSETLVKTAPILLCALAAIVPGRLGLISVGAEGQLQIGAVFGTAVVLACPGWPAAVLMPAMLVAGMAGGALWAAVPALLKTRLAVNETITTLLLNHVAVLCVGALVYGPWKDPGNLGWPATAPFPDAAVLPAFFGTRVHFGLVAGVAAAIALYLLMSRGRFALRVAVLAGNRKVGETFGIDFARHALVVMAIGGAAAGFAGIAETSAIQGRLQPGISAGYGLTGFLVAWLCGHNALAAVPVSLLIGGLIAAGDALQLYAKVPSAAATVLQGLLFATALAVPGLLAKGAARLAR